ncbi:MAG: DUF4197 domain-containing protein [Desulfobacterales bacterium]|nr:DUF4197 domain-containing protein [Desulfobacterales bacterium]
MKKGAVCFLGLMLFWVAGPAQAQFGDILKSVQKTIGGTTSTGTSLGESEIAQGLKEALQVGTKNAVEKVSVAGGYLNNPEIRIPLPPTVKKVETLLKVAGYGPQVESFEKSMNQAAEKAAPEARSLFVDAITRMTITDAQKILNGRENEATLYFKDKTETKLHEIFEPVVHDTMAQVGVTKKYQDLDAKMKTFPLGDKLSFDLDGYVTQGALDGLFLMLAQEEKKIRENPAARVTDLLKKVFQ